MALFLVSLLDLGPNSAQEAALSDVGPKSVSEAASRGSGKIVLLLASLLGVHAGVDGLEEDPPYVNAGSCASSSCAAEGKYNVLRSLGRDQASQGISSCWFLCRR